MQVIYGRGSERITLTPNVLELSWSSSRGQLSQVCDMTILNSPPLASAGFIMLFEGSLNSKDQIFHGPIVRFQRDDHSKDLSATAYEISWYLTKNEVTRLKLSGDPGNQLNQIIGAAGDGIKFSCPALGFSMKERTSAQSYASLYSMIMDKAYERTGIRYYLYHRRDQLFVTPEGKNSLVPVFQAVSLDSSSTGESIEEVYNIVRVEKYKNDKLVSSVTKQDTASMNKIGYMQKIIDAGEEKDLASLAARELKRLTKIPVTRSITVRHNDPTAAKIRAGWRIDIIESDGKTTTSWIVTSCKASWRINEYTMQLELERR